MKNKEALAARTILGATDSLQPRPVEGRGDLNFWLADHTDEIASIDGRRAGRQPSLGNVGAARHPR